MPPKGFFRRHQSMVGYGLLGTAVAMSAWRYDHMRDYFSLDDSWIIGLYLAHRRGYQWGQDIVFTYGPLGFLEHPRLAFGWWGLLALAVNLGALAAVAATLARSWSVRIRAWCAWPLTLIVLTAATWNVEVFVAAGTMLVLHTTLRSEERRRILVALATAAGGGLILLVKLSVAPIVMGLVVVTAVLAAPSGHRRWSAATALAVCSVSFLGGWVLLGQGLGSLPSFLRGSAQIASGYAGAMGVEVAGGGWHYAAAVAAIGLTMAAWLRRTRAEERWDRWCCLALIAMALFVFFRLGFVRHDEPHVATFFSAALLLAAVPPPKHAPRHGRLPGALAATSILVLMLFVVVRVGDLEVDTFVAGPSRAVDLPASVRHARSGTGLAAARSWAGAWVGAPTKLIRTVGDESVHIHPWDISVAWAHDLNWRPAPVFQVYSAYTDHLDALNASFLADRGPRYVLARTGMALDQRNPVWETPQYRRALLCHYHTAGQEGTWELLERLPEERCGRQERIEVHYDVEGAVGVPRQGRDIVVMTTTCRSTLRDQVMTTMFKPARTSYAIADGKRHRLVPALLSGPMIVRGPDVQIDRIEVVGCAEPPDVAFHRFSLRPVR
jgi:hypothetical protein